MDKVRREFHRTRPTEGNLCGEGRVRRILVSAGSSLIWWHWEPLREREPSRRRAFSKWVGNQRHLVSADSFWHSENELNLWCSRILEWTGRNRVGHSLSDGNSTRSGRLRRDWSSVRSTNFNEKYDGNDITTCCSASPDFLTSWYRMSLFSSP